MPIIRARLLAIVVVYFNYCTTTHQDIRSAITLKVKLGLTAVFWSIHNPLKWVWTHLVQVVPLLVWAPCQTRYPPNPLNGSHLCSKIFLWAFFENICTSGPLFTFPDRTRKLCISSHLNVAKFALTATQMLLPSDGIKYKKVSVRHFPMLQTNKVQEAIKLLWTGALTALQQRIN